MAQDGYIPASPQDPAGLECLRTDTEDNGWDVACTDTQCTEFDVGQGTVFTP